MYIDHVCSKFSLVLLYISTYLVYEFRTVEFVLRPHHLVLLVTEAAISQYVTQRNLFEIDPPAADLIVGPQNLAYILPHVSEGKVLHLLEWQPLRLGNLVWHLNVNLLVAVDSF